MVTDLDMPRRSLWLARASTDPRIDQLKPMRLTPKRVAEIRLAVKAAAANDPFVIE